MFSIKEIITEKGVLRIPEFINVGTIVNSQGLLYRLEHVGHNAFDNLTNLKELQIPTTVIRLEWSFYNCPNLAAIYVDEGNPTFCSIDGVLYSKDQHILIAYPNAHGIEYTLPEGVEEIAHFAFKTCRDIVRIKLSDSVKKIGNNVFCQCNKLEEVFLPNGIREIGDTTEPIHARFWYQRKWYRYEDLKSVVK